MPPILLYNEWIRKGAMGQPDIATQRGTTMSALPPTFAPPSQVLETMPSGFAATCNCEDVVWTELTYRGRTFEFNRGLHIRALKEDGGWAFESDDPELMGFGHTRAEAELTFCLDFAAQWDDLACEDDEKLTLDAKEVKYALLSLVRAQR
jgi:hypothetical protein